jgi:predicted nucleotidyltransferase
MVGKDLLRYIISCTYFLEDRLSRQQMTRDQVLQQLRLKKPEFSQRYGVTRLALFGSFAYETPNNESDIDVIVELEVPDIFALVHIKEELEFDFQRSVDIIPYSDFLNPYLKRRIALDALYV